MGNSAVQSREQETKIVATIVGRLTEYLGILGQGKILALWSRTGLLGW